LPTDHGHGDTVKAEWTSHGNKFEGSSGIYFAAMGPKLKVRRNKNRISIVSKSICANNGKNNGLYV
jgi:hypothetical protein